ncbi:MAG: hypothetical protein HY077_03805 [Elusimicrobia bacterium]|nr:hypothetical protein [Elusimicrobiota bacterium]
MLLKQIRLATAHVPTGKTRHSKGSRELPPPAEFQIVKYPDDPGFYLLYLDERGKEQMDTLHDTIDAVLSQAKWEFKINPDEWTTLGPQPDSSGK